MSRFKLQGLHILLVFTGSETISAICATAV